MGQFKGHIGIVGMSGGGKTTLAVLLCDNIVSEWKLRKLKKCMVVHTPRAPKRFPPESVKVRSIDSLEHVLRVMDKDDIDGVAVLDEVVDLVEDMTKEHKLFGRLHRKGRHGGLQALYITQDFIEIPPKVRRNLGALYVFNTGADDYVARKIQQAYSGHHVNGVKLFDAIRSLKQYEFIRIQKDIHSCQKFKLPPC